MGVCNTYCSKCSSRDLTWCVRVNDMEVISIAQGLQDIQSNRMEFGIKRMGEVDLKPFQNVRNRFILLYIQSGGIQFQNFGI
ncbi:hypothetical protein LguiA_004692 [Lonicera macranthoides]